MDHTGDAARLPGPLQVSLKVDTGEEDPSVTEEVAQLLATATGSSADCGSRLFLRFSEGGTVLLNDPKYQNLDLQHIIAKRVLGGQLGLAPVDHPGHVLDLGTGTGIWAIEFAELCPGSQVVGTDISPIRPDRIPDNCLFNIADIEKKWNYWQKFDYIHGRYLCAALQDFPALFKTIYDNLKPGGWVEFQETLTYFEASDESLVGRPLYRWNELLLQGLEKLGRDSMAGAKYRDWMADAGFVNVQERTFAVPINTWAQGAEQKLLGALQMTTILEGLEGITMSVFTRAHGWTVDDIKALLAEVRRDVQNRDIHAYVPILVTWAQKSSDSTDSPRA